MTAQISAGAPTFGVGKLLMEHCFVVPSHQRDYDWEDPKIKQLLDDIEDVRKPNSFYFIGMTVFMKECDDRLRVLDGQQRLATTVLFLSAIRNWFAVIDPELSSRIQQEYIGSSEYGEKDVNPRLELNYHNNETFQRYVVSGAHLSEIKKALSTTKKNDPNYQVLSAAKICHERVTHIAGRFSGAQEAKAYLISILKFIRDSVSVVRLIVPDEANASQVFETLNDRGQDLSSMDLVKNHLFGLVHNPKTPNRLGDMELRWAQMMQILSNSKPDEFLKVYWTSRKGRVQLGGLYPELKKATKDADTAIDLSQDFLAVAEEFTALENPDDLIWAPHGPDVKRSLRDLKLIGSKQVRPVVLSALKRFDKREFARLLRLLEVILVRYQLVGGERTGTLEISCARAAEQIFVKKLTNAASVKEAMRDVYPSDSDFQLAFSMKQETSPTKIQFLLRGLEVERRRQERGIMASEETLGDLSIEHILPRGPGSEWADVVADDRDLVEECTDRLGNICLLTKGANTLLGRSAFAAKRRLYADSKILLTRDVAERAEWNRQAIEHRQAALAKLAVQAWRFQ